MSPGNTVKNQRIPQWRRCKLCVEISSKRYNNLNCGSFEKGKETKSNKQNCNEASVVPVTDLIVETLQSMSMIETLSKQIGNQFGKKLCKSELCMLNISKSNVDRVKLELTWGFPKAPQSISWTVVASFIVARNYWK